VLYLDTSALIKLYVSEAETVDAASWVRSQNDAVPYNSLHELELASVLERRRATGDLAETAARRIWRTIEGDLGRGVLQRTQLDWGVAFSHAIQLVRRHGRDGLRALDGLHLACALQLKPTMMITYDRVQSIAASSEGLVVRPEA
jgi:predicted nucleic acid-binding protein